MSTAIAAGLYHPRCKDSHTTYFSGISTADDRWTKEELENVRQANKKEAEQQYARQQYEKCSRMSKYSLGEDNKRIYAARAADWKVRAGEEIAKDALEKVGESSTMKIRSLINQRNTGKGNPNAVLQFGAELNNRQKKLLENLSEVDSRTIVPKSSVKMSDLSALTAKTGD